MSGPRSPPLPFSPWQEAQIVSNVLRPEDDFEADVCAEQMTQAEIKTTTIHALRHVMRC